MIKESGKIYDSARLATGYAYNRPPVHKRIIEKISDQLQIKNCFGRALDIGCGAGLSTVALESIAKLVVGIEPMRMMLVHCKAVSRNALFIVSTAELLPFANRSFELITAAGSLNYTNLDLFLPEAERILASDVRPVREQ